MVRLRRPGEGDAIRVRVEAEGVRLRRIGENDDRLGIRYVRCDDDGHARRAGCIIEGENRG